MWSFRVCVIYKNKTLFCIYSPKNNKALSSYISSKSLWVFVYPKKGWISMIFCTLTLDGQLWPSISLSFQLHFLSFCPHIIHIDGLYLLPIFYDKWNMSSWYTSPKTYNFEDYIKLKRLKFQCWKFSICHPNISFITKTFSFKSFTTLLT
jgi:hypothetical protein